MHSFHSATNVRMQLNFVIVRKTQIWDLDWPQILEVWGAYISYICLTETPHTKTQKVTIFLLRPGRKLHTVILKKWTAVSVLYFLTLEPLFTTCSIALLLRRNVTTNSHYTIENRNLILIADFKQNSLPYLNWQYVQHCCSSFTWHKWT
jgi:hypothetical protein